jgi:hypothetical protein
MEGNQEHLALTEKGHSGVTLDDVAKSLTAVRPSGDRAGLIDQLRDLEDLKSAASALQARLLSRLMSWRGAPGVRPVFPRPNRAKV